MGGKELSGVPYTEGRGEDEHLFSKLEERLGGG